MSDAGEIDNRKTVSDLLGLYQKSAPIVPLFLYSCASKNNKWVSASENELLFLHFFFLREHFSTFLYIDPSSFSEIK